MRISLPAPANSRISRSACLPASFTARAMLPRVTARRVSSRSMSSCNPVALVMRVPFAEEELISLTPLTNVNSSNSFSSSSQKSEGSASAPSICGAAEPWR